jgi:thiosulfate/3-mercaptopyruvate sulfurtransferase
MANDPVISAPELARLLRTSDTLVLLDCRVDRDAYAAGHLPGARHADLECDLSSARVAGADPAHGGRHPLPEPARFAETLAGWGITPASHVVAYDDQAGANAAARLWWMLRALGHAHVQVLDGGIAAARAEGIAETRELPPPTRAPAYPAQSFAAAPQATLKEVQTASHDASACVLDVRAAARYRGEVEPIDPVAGHIPGAVNVPFASNLEGNGRFRPAAQLRAEYEQLLAGRSPSSLIVHCGSGVTACHTLLALERAGLTGARLYVGSWSEWCRHPELPVGRSGRDARRGDG